MDKRDFFISYSHHDEPWARGIAGWLREAGYTVFYQAEHFPPGSNFILKMQEAMVETHRTLAILSHQYLESRYTPSEWADALNEDPDGKKRKLILVRIDDCEVPHLLRSIVRIDVAGLKLDAIQEKVMNGVSSALNTADSTQPPLPPRSTFEAGKRQSRPRSTKQPTGKVKQSVRGDNNVTVGGDLYYNPRVTSHTTVQPGPEHIPPEQARKIQELVHELSEISVKAGGPKTHGKWYTKLKNTFKVPSYQLVPRERGDEVISWLHQQIAQQRSKLRNTNSAEWCKQHYTAIYARAKQLRMSKEELYALATNRLKTKVPVTSLTDLGKIQLGKLYKIVFGIKK